MLFEWMFSGIGNEALKAIKKLVSNPDDSGIGHTAQGAKIADSPAQGGQGNYLDNSRISIGTVVLPAQPNPLSEPEPRPRHNIDYAGCETLPIEEYPNGRLSPFPSNIVPYQGHVVAVVVGFTNDSTVGLTPKGVLVEGTIIYKQNGKEIARTTGQWLEQSKGEVYFKVNRAFKLALVLKNSTGRLFAPDMFCQTLARRVYWAASHHDLGKIEDLVALVKLTRVTSNECLFEGEFEIRLDPLQVTRIR
jgi:hypothetical protein